MRHPKYPAPDPSVTSLIGYVEKYLKKSDADSYILLYYIENCPKFTDKSVIDNEGIWADKSDITEDELKKRKIWKNNKLVTLDNTNIKFINGKPQTPVVIGIRGRGLLGKFGPNHAADPIVTRYNKNTGDLEFVAGLRSDTNPPQWCIPGGMVDEGESVSATLKREFQEEVASTCEQNILDQVFKDGKVIYAGPTYGDPRTTDEAWIETYVVHYHIENDISEKIPLTKQEGENRAVAWISCKTANLYGDHKKFVNMVAANMWYKKFYRVRPNSKGAVKIATCIFTVFAVFIVWALIAYAMSFQ